MAVEDEALRQRLTKLLGTSRVDLELVDPKVDPLNAPPERLADFVILRRSSVGPDELRRLENAQEGCNLVVVTDGADDHERAQLFSAGVSGVLDASDSALELREAFAAIAAAEGSAPRDPHRGRGGGEPRLSDFHSRSARMRSFLQLVDRVVDTDSSLLVTGETGVGKERLAQAIHNEGARRHGPFVSVNCGAIPEALLESELFGHVAGAFTGAERQKRGRFELASGGTIFLDEIGEMPVHLQVNLLSVLQRHQVQRVGGEDLLRVDVRVMAATNRDLATEVREGRFREDLYYRLNVVSLEIPPLRERAEDIPDMVGSFIRHFRGTLGRSQVNSITADALEALMRYPWPGNVRQLINAVEHAIVVCRSPHISLADLPQSVVSPASALDAQVAPAARQTGRGPTRPPQDDAPQNDAPQSDTYARWCNLPLREARNEVVREFERTYLEHLLRRTKGRVGHTADLAGITPRSLYDKLKLYDLRKDDYR
ncbi:MAG: sigma-54 dependent transcriptional regulator [Planctomycetota bacterium]